MGGVLAACAYQSPYTTAWNHGQSFPRSGLTRCALLLLQAVEREELGAL